MNNDPQLIIFEPLKKPRTITFKDTDTELGIIDENGHKVTNYKVIFDESESTTSPDKDKIVAYIENWESQGNVVDEKQARKIEKRKRIQGAKKLKKERNKKRKAAMKSLIHCNFDRNSLANTKDVEEERAILRAMKTQKHSIKNILNIKPNRIINCDTNVRPFENSTIEIGSRKTPIDVVVLDSDEESDSDSDDIQINIDTPQPIQRRNRRTTNLASGGTFRNQNSFVTSNSNARKRRNKKVEIVQIVDSSDSDSDVECVSCEEFIESLSDDEDGTSTSKRTGSRYINLEKESAADVPVDEEASDALVNLVDSFVSKYIQTAMPPLIEIPAESDAEFSYPQIMITEPVSLQPNPASPSVESLGNQTAAPQIAISEPVSLQQSPLPMRTKSPKNVKTAPQIVISEPVTLQPSPASTRTKSKKKKKVFFNNAVDESIANDNVLHIIENEPMKVGSVAESIPQDSHESDDSNEFEVVSEDEDEDGCNPNVMEFDSIPSPDYTPTECIPATASNMKAFADFMRSRQIPDSGEDDEPGYDSPVELTDHIPAPTTKPAVKPNYRCPTPSPRTPLAYKNQPTPAKRNPPASKNQSYPWLKRGYDESEEIHVIEPPPVNRNQSSQPWRKRCYDKSSEIAVVEPPPVIRNQSSQPWQKRCHDKSDDIQVVDKSEQASQVDFDNEEHSQNTFPDQRFQRKPQQRIASLPKVNNTSDAVQTQCTNRTSAFNRLGNTNVTPASQPRCLSGRPCVFNRLGNVRADTPKSNSAVEFFDKNNIRIGESQNQPKKVCRSDEYVEQERYTDPVDVSGRSFQPKRFFNDGRDRESNESYQGPENSQSEQFDESHWQNTSASDYEMRFEGDSHQPQQPCEMVQEKFPMTAVPCNRRDRYHPEPYEENKYVPKRNRYHPEPYEEEKFVPNRNRYHPEQYEEDKYVPASAQSFDNRQIPWRNQNRGRPFYRHNHNNNNNQYHNRHTGFNDNNSNRGNRFQPRFQSNQGQRFNRFPPNQRFYRQNTQNTTKYSRQTGGDDQYSNNNQQSSYTQDNCYRSQFQTPSSSSVNTPNVQAQPNPELLFTRRRDKFDYKANVDHFDNYNDKPQESSGRNSYYNDRNTNSNQHSDVKNYETDVVKKLLTNTFSWENNRACDFVPVNANEPVAPSPPWCVDDTNIKAISRRQWIGNRT